MTTNATRPSGDADERTQLIEWLDLQRATVRRKCEGLSDDDAHRAPLPSSPLMSMAGVVAHLRWVEYIWFEHNLQGVVEPDTPWAHDDHPDAEMKVEGIPLERLLDDYDRACQRSTEITVAHGLDDLERRHGSNREPVSLRWIMLHMIEETARHLGHLDAIRELIDGETGYY